MVMKHIEATVVASPLGGGDHILECSLCGPVGIAADDLWFLMSREHLASHKEMLV